MKDHQYYADQNASIDAFDPNKQTVSYAVWFPGRKDMTLYNKRGPANAAITSAFPRQLGVLYENRNGAYVELDRAPVPECSFCREIIEPRSSYLDNKNFLILKTPQYKSALMCGTCRDNGLHKDEALVDQIRYLKGL